MKPIIFVVILYIYSANCLADTPFRKNLILTEIQNSIKNDYDLEGEMKTIHVIEDQSADSTKITKKKSRGKLLIEKQMEENRKQLARLHGESDDTAKLSAKERMNQILKKNREKIKTRQLEEKNRSSSDSMINQVKRWENRSLKKVSAWEEAKKAELKKWELDKKRFLGMLPIYKENLVNIENEFKEENQGSIPQKEIPPKIITKKVELPVFEDVYMVKGAFNSDVKDQGKRPTCAAFAGIRALEIVLAAKGTPKKLSEQYFYWASKPKCQSLPCSTGGSWVLSGYRKSQSASTPDIPASATCLYQPHGVDGNTTQVPLYSGCTEGVAKVGSFYQVESMDEILNAIKNDRPVVGGFKLSKNFYQNNGYVFLSDKSGSAKLDAHAAGHAILLIGYMKLPVKLHQSEGRICLMVANSWGTGWGKGGHACLSEKWLQTYRYNVPFIAVNDVY